MVQPFTLLVVDYQMPDLDGCETTKLIRRHYQEVMQPVEGDDPRTAEVRKRIFEPVIVCCSAYDEKKIYE